MYSLCLLTRHAWFTVFEAIVGALREAWERGGMVQLDEALDRLFEYAHEMVNTARAPVCLVHNTDNPVF